MTYSFTTEKKQAKIIIGHKIFICQPIFGIFWHFLRFLEFKRMIRSHLAGGDSVQGDIQKGSFQRMV